MLRTGLIFCAALALIGLAACASDATTDQANAAWAACVNATEWHACLNQRYTQLSAQNADREAASNLLGYALFNAGSTYAASRQASQPIFIGCTQSRNVVNCIGQ